MLILLLLLVYLFSGNSIRDSLGTPSFGVVFASKGLRLWIKLREKFN